MARVSIRGLVQARQAFQRLPAAFREAMGDATRTTASEIARLAKAKVRRRFGYLQKQIAFSASARTGTAKVGIATGTFTRAGVGGSALTARGASAARPTKYGHLVEFGHVLKTRGGLAIGTVRPYPFMVPAAEAQRAPYAQRVAAAGKKVERDFSVSRFT